jgi:hypothetical protein
LNKNKNLLVFFFCFSFFPKSNRWLNKNAARKWTEQKKKKHPINVVLHIHYTEKKEEEEEKQRS